MINQWILAIAAILSILLGLEGMARSALSPVQQEHLQESDFLSSDSYYQAENHDDDDDDDDDDEDDDEDDDDEDDDDDDDDDDDE